MIDITPAYKINTITYFEDGDYGFIVTGNIVQWPSSSKRIKNTYHDVVYHTTTRGLITDVFCE